MDVEVPVSAAGPKRNSILGAGMSSGQKARFPGSARLLRRSDFERVYKLGKRHFSASMTFFYLQRREAKPQEDSGKGGAAEKLAKIEQGGGSFRVGFTVGRALGGAVQRNRMKRRLREAVRLSGLTSGIAADVVVNPKKSLLTADFRAVVNEVSSAFAVIEQKLTGKQENAPGGLLRRDSGLLKPEVKSPKAE